jgi:hypothetical protein
MRFTILVTSIENTRSKAIVAHNLAGNRGVSLQLAMSLLDNLPVLYQANLSKEDAGAAVARLAKIGVKANAVSSDMRAPEENASLAVAPPPKPPSPPPVEPLVLGDAPRQRFSYIGRAPENEEPKSGKKRKVRLIAAVILGICFAALIVIGAREKFGFRIPASGLLEASADSAKQKAIKVPASRNTMRRQNPTLQNPDTDVDARAASAREQSASQAYADSAKACADLREAVAFYKMALSFNKRNVNAWYGLINAYTQAHLPDEADTAKANMKKIFGEDVLSLTQIVARFGELIDMYTTQDGTFRVEYRSRHTGRDELLHETFLLGKALAPQCDCAALSLYARSAGSTGLLVFFKTDDAAVSFEGFQATASVTYLQ